MSKKICEIVGCPQLASSRSLLGYCGGHEHNLRNYGDPYITGPGGKKQRDMSPEMMKGYPLYHSKIVPGILETPCYIWQKYRSFKERADGSIDLRYGRTNWRKEKLCHRISWIIENGPIPDGMEIGHRCHEPGCHRESHLELTTKADNVRLTYQVGRAATKHGSQRFDREGLLEFKEFCVENPELNQREIAKHFGISQPMVSSILRGKRYGWAK